MCARTHAHPRAGTTAVVLLPPPTVSPTLCFITTRSDITAVGCGRATPPSPPRPASAPQLYRSTRPRNSVRPVVRVVQLDTFLSVAAAAAAVAVTHRSARTIEKETKKR